MRVAYLINQYPKISHTFIRREILALERQGVVILRFALRGWDNDLVDEQDFLERNRTHYVLRDGFPTLMLASLRLLVTRPHRFIRALRLAYKLSCRAERPLPVHLAYLAEACRIEVLLRKARANHVHAHFGTNSAEVAMLQHVLGGPQWSFTVHGPEEFDKAAMIGLAEKLRRCAFAIAVSSFGRSQLFRLVDPEQWTKVKVVPCGLDETSWRRASAWSPARRLVCVGRLCEQKGQLLLIEAARRLASDGTVFELVLAGDGELRAGIDAAVARYGLGSRVRITGWVGADRVREEILAARAVVLASFAEGLPVVLMEAMALRRPVISTYVAGIPELVVAGEHGWLVPAGDIEALVQAMQSSLDAPMETLVRMGEAARRHVLDRHDIRKQAAQLAGLFESSTEASGSR